MISMEKQTTFPPVDESSYEYGKNRTQNVD